MQNPGSDAGVFVWADGADDRYCAVNTDARCNVTLKNSQRHAEDKTVTLAGISLLCTRLGKYTMVCVDNLKNILRESRKPNRQSAFP